MDLSSYFSFSYISSVTVSHHLDDVFSPGTSIAMQNIANYGIPTYVTCEPLMQFDLAELVELVGMCSPQQVNIGRNSRYDITLPEPTANEVKMLKAELEKFTKVEVKANAHCWMR